MTAPTAVHQIPPSRPRRWPAIPRRRELLWSLLIAGVCFVPGQTALFAPRGSAVVELTLVTGQPGAVELFFDTGDGFKATQVSRRPLRAGGPQVVRLPIPSGEYLQLRLDPTNTADTVAISDVAIRERSDHGGTVIDASQFVPMHQITEARVESGRLVVTSSGDDPSLVWRPARPIRVGSGGRLLAATRLVAMFCLVAAVALLACRLVSLGMARCPPAVGTAACMAFAAAALIAPRLPWLGAPLLDFYAFRQTQTALSAQWLAREGLSLPAYPLPVLGRPWTAPFEFPTFQIVSAAVHRLGVPLDLACRGVAVAVFAGCFVVLAWALRRHGCPDFVLAAVWVFALATPFALVWSKASLIEFTAVLLGLGYVGVACELHARRPTGLLAAAVVTLGVAAAVTKITTFAVFLPACGLIAGHGLWQMRRCGCTAAGLGAAALVWAAALAVPVVVGQAWVDATDAVKESCEATAWLTSAGLGGWNFGTMAQRLDPGTWLTIGRRIQRHVLPFVWPFACYGIVVLARLPVRVALAGLGMVAGAIASGATFFNLYVVHDYYLCASVFPLWLAAAAGLHGVAERLPAAGKSRHLILPAVLLLLLVVSFRSRLVAGSYGDLGGDEFVAFATAVRQTVPEGEEIVIFGDDWDSRLPYYTERKALMVKSPHVSEAYVVDYAARHGVRYFIACGAGGDVMRRLVPDTSVRLRAGGFELHERDLAR